MDRFDRGVRPENGARTDYVADDPSHWQRWRPEPGVGMPRLVSGPTRWDPAAQTCGLRSSRPCSTVILDKVMTVRSGATGFGRFLRPRTLVDHRDRDRSVRCRGIV